MSVIHIATIPGIMVGVEWDYINKFFVVDLFLVRIVWDYWGYDREEENTPE